ncbi:hypothetical protein [Schlesneria paludicola]|uniref:hypothetical protein n=1 Tax=Schlesneria paludicola TaxID=360056 RepID=UPI00029A0F4A|nr:hypothetical protein [Schlesneria paludicola]
MRKFSMLMVFVVGVSVLSFGLAGGMDDEAAKPAGNEISELKAEFANLNKKVAELEEKVRQLETNPQIAIGSVPAPDSKAVPKSWQQRQFNGQPYYVVPLMDTKSKR